MSKLFQATLLVSVLALAACNNPNRFGDRPDGDAAGAGLGAGGVATSALGDPNDPRSLAHFQQRVGDRVFFAVDQHTLSAEARTILSGQAQWLAANPGYAVIMEGHADEQGTREYNLALGARRAQAARDFLVSQGVGPESIRTISYGKERPVEVCSTESCYARNRRAVTVLSVGAGG